MRILIVVNSTKEWPFSIPGVEVVEARAYLTQPEYSELRNVKLFNLCRSYRYQSAGYYVTLLATARGHKPLPNITTLQDLKNQTVARFVSDDLDEVIQRSLAPIQSDRFTLSVYFGRNLAMRYDRLSLNLFNVVQAPLLRAHFARNSKWELRRIEPIPLGEIPPGHHDFVIQVATEYFAGRRSRMRKRARAKYDLAILYDPHEEGSPSDPKAIQRFERAAESLGFEVELITRDDYARLAEFDALFIRDTTWVTQYTYRFSRRAAIEGLVVVDDPESILKCTNKVYFAELMERYDVPIPRTLLVHGDNVDQITNELGFPCVLKQPDAAFSKGVVKVDDEAALKAQAEKLLDRSEFIVAQEFLPTEFDWRIGIFDRQPLFACKYFMAHKHWQIIKHDGGGSRRYGRFETVPVELAPRKVVRLALRAANLIGDGLYGVDVKEMNGKCYVIEVNDNPNIDAGVEDAVLRDELYRRIMSVFLRRIERQKAGAGA